MLGVGAQNAFVLRAGRRRRHAVAAAAGSALADAVLIAAGVAGIGPAAARVPGLERVALVGGVGYLLYHSLRSFRAALRPALPVLDPAAPDRQQAGTRGTFTAAFALSLLNPHAYVDAVVLFGGLAAHRSGTGRLLFALGAAAAAAAWYAGLAGGAARLAPLFRRPGAWRVIDAVVGAVMLLVAASLVAGALGSWWLRRPHTH